MGRHIWEKQNWVRWNPVMMLNFHDYGYRDGSVLTIVRYNPKKGWTREMLGKYRVINGEILPLKSDDKKPDEKPHTWWTPERLIKLRRDFLRGEEE